MRTSMRRLIGITGIGLSWAVAWTVFFGVLALIIGIMRPQDIDRGEGPAVILRTGLLVGFVSGTLFGSILSFTESRKKISDLPLLRVALWGMIAGAAWPLLTYVDDRMVFVLAPLGAFCAASALAVASKAELPDGQATPLKRVLNAVIGRPLRAACASEE